MQAFGSDRVRPGEGEQFILSSRQSKGWTARVPKTLTTAEFPGTAILWEERYFEVISAEPLPQGGVRYVLAPWKDNHAMRLSERYDAETEAWRAEEYRKQLERERNRKSATALGFLTGHLPGAVQEEMASEWGTMPSRMTMMSAAPLIILAGVPAFISFALMFGGYPPLVPLPLVAVLGYLTAESVLRFNLAFLRSEPYGSLIGHITYAIYALSRGKSQPKVKGNAVPTPKAPEDIAARDAFTVREAFVTLLTPAEQMRVAERFPYDYKRDSAAVAFMLLIAAVIGVASSIHAGAVVPLVVAAALGIEQIVRLIAFRRGPAGSVLRFVVRPLVRKLL